MADDMHYSGLAPSSQEYFDYYYSQSPLDTRLPKPELTSPVSMIQKDFPSTQSSPLIPSRKRHVVTEPRGSYLSPLQVIMGFRPGYQDAEESSEDNKMEWLLSTASHRQVTLDEVLSYEITHELAMNHDGAILLQRLLPGSNSAQTHSLIEQLCIRDMSVITSPFGNYLVQALLDCITPEQRDYISIELRGSALRLALDGYGSRVLQKAIELSEERIQCMLVSELHGHVLKLAKDRSGNHVLQRCVKSIPSRHLRFMVDDLQRDILGMCTHVYGCRVVQVLLETIHFTSDDPFISSILDVCRPLIPNKFGNYIIQHLLGSGEESICRRIRQVLTGHLLEYSLTKFSSRVVEKAFVNTSHQVWVPFYSFQPDNTLIGSCRVCI